MVKTQEIALPQEVRVFRKRSETDEMYPSGRKPLPKGTVVTLGQPRKLVFDFRNQWATPVNTRGLCGDNHFLITEEIGIPDLIPI